MLQPTDSDRKAPDFLRSSVRNAMPRAMASPGWRSCTRAPSRWTSPASAGTMPNSDSITSVRPEPISPATPSTSPARTSNDTSR